MAVLYFSNKADISQAIVKVGSDNVTRQRNLNQTDRRCFFRNEKDTSNCRSTC